MLYYNKYFTGIFKREFKDLDKTGIRQLIMPLFEHCFCDSLSARLNPDQQATFAKFLYMHEKARKISSINPCAGVHYALIKQGQASKN